MSAERAFELLAVRREQVAAKGGSPTKKAPAKKAPAKKTAAKKRAAKPKGKR